MRAEYLWYFAYVLHFDANQVDALRYVDFIQYIPGLDKYRDEVRRANDGRNN